MKRKLTRGSSGVVLPIQVDDTSRSDGGGLEGLSAATPNLAWRYWREGDSAWQSVTLAGMTPPAHVPGGWYEAGRGTYLIGVPDVALAQGNWVIMQIYGAAGMADVRIEIELDAIEYQSANVRADLRQIDGVDSASAVLNLRQIVIDNPDTTAVRITTESGLGAAIEVNGAVEGVKITGNNSDAVALYGVGRAGLYAIGAADGAGILVEGSGVGAAVRIAGGTAGGVVVDGVRAYPIAQPDTGATAIARGGGGGDTLASLSDQIDAFSGGTGGSSDVPVDHNTGGADALQYTINGAGADDVQIVAYLKSDYDAGQRIVRGTTSTGPDGRWLAPLLLDRGSTYCLVARVPGLTEAVLTPLTVS